MAIIICILMAFIIWEERRASSEYKGVFDPKAISKLIPKNQVLEGKIS
jgi:hypothetical protein